MQKNTKRSLANNLKIFKYPLLPGILWGFIILILMSIPGNSFPVLDLSLLLSPDKIIHAFVFGLLQVLLAIGISLKKHNLLSYKKVILISCISTLSYSIVTEGIQALLFTSRKADVLDIIANAVGIILSIFVSKYFIKKQKKLEPS